jgi:transposase
MSKIQEYYEDCERCYISENMSFDEIASRYPVSEKTLRNWAEKGNWQDRRKAYRTKQATLNEKLHNFVDKLMDTILDDWNNGRRLIREECMLSISYWANLKKFRNMKMHLSRHLTQRILRLPILKYSRTAFETYWG